MVAASLTVLVGEAMAEVVEGVSVAEAVQVAVMAGKGMVATMAVSEEASLPPLLLLGRNLLLAGRGAEPAATITEVARAVAAIEEAPTAVPCLLRVAGATRGALRLATRQQTAAAVYR